MVAEQGVLLDDGVVRKVTPEQRNGRGISSWRETLVITASFMAAYTAYLAIQSLQSSLNQEAGLGVVSLACLYGTIILSGIFSPSFLGVVGAKWSIIIGVICHCLYTASNFYSTWATLIPASILLGGISGPMWTAQGLYLTANGENISRQTGKDLHVVLSKLNGVFFLFYESTQITGNLISSLILQQGSYSDSEFSNVTIVSQCGVDDCPSVSNATEIVEPEARIVYILLGVFLFCDVVAVVLVVCFLPPLSTSHRPAAERGPVAMLASWWTALADIKLLCLAIFYMSCTMSFGVLYADLTKSFISCSLGVAWVGFIMASHGAVTAAVAIATSHVAKFTGRYLLFGVAIICNISILVSLVFWLPDSGHIAPFFLVTSTWGIAVGIFHTQNNALVGLMFPEKKEAAFANYHTWNAIGFTLTFAYGGVLCVRIKLYICLAFAIVGSIGYIVAEILYARQTRTISKTSEESRDLKVDLKIER